MDPDVLLSELIAETAELDTIKWPDCDQTLFESIAEKFAALDEWLSKGGFLPERWQHASRR